MMFPVRFAVSLYVGSFQDVETLAATNPMLFDTEIPAQPVEGDLFHFEDEECTIYKATRVYWSHPLGRYVVDLDFSATGGQREDTAAEADKVEEEVELDDAEVASVRKANFDRADQIEATLVGAGFKVDEENAA